MADLIGYVEVEGKKYFCGRGNTKRTAEAATLGNLHGINRRDLQGTEKYKRVEWDEGTPEGWGDFTELEAEREWEDM